MNDTSLSADEPLSSADPISPAKEKLTLLVVDDEEGPRQSVRFVFKDEYHVLMADSGLRALELARAHPINAAVLDIRMPGMSGIDVLNELKALDATIEVVMLTAHETLDTARQALRLGACDYLNKPFDLPTLRKSVRNAMERHTAASEMRENNSNLQKLQEEIHEQKMREEEARKRGDIYASIIHDINGPLTIISGFIETINQRLGDTKTLEGEKLDIVRDRLNRITRQVINCVQISRRYLGFLRGCTHEASYVSVNQVLSDLEQLLHSHPDRARNQLALQPLPHDIAVAINGTDLIQILLNLVINAFQSSPQSHRVEVRCEPLTEPLDFTRLANTAGVRFLKSEGFVNQLPSVAVSVRDDGPGIAVEVLGRLFEPYFTTKMPGQGTGLGLSIVRRLVDQAKGAIAVETDLGKGTAFTVYLPARADGASAAQA